MIDVAANPSDAVEKALDLFGNDILRLAYSYMKSREDAEDIVQEVLIRLMQSAGVFEDESHEKAWLLKVASRQREVAIPEGYDVADEKQEQKEESDILQIISQLPEKYRSAIHLYYYEEYSVKEIAEILEKKETTIRSLLKRGREKLARMLPQQMKGDDGHAAGI